MQLLHLVCIFYNGVYSKILNTFQYYSINLTILERTFCQMDPSVVFFIHFGIEHGFLIENCGQAL